MNETIRPSRTIAGIASVAVVSACLLALPAQAQKVPVTERTLSNGMRLLMVERHDEPSVAGGWVAHVGSANERPGITGIAHLFEHMMFKGTPTLGTKDYAKDLEIIAAQEKVREETRREESKLRAAVLRGEIDDLLKPENRTGRLQELDKQFKELVEQQRAILVKNEFDRVYTTGGASGMNASTSQDITQYFITVPANKLELWMWMESERLLRPVFREFYAERDVVFEERRMRTESTPLGKFEESFNAMFWDAHPYSWPTVGWPSDIPSISKAQADEFYAQFYCPQNITLVLVGDFKSADAEAACERYFGRIPRGKQDPPELVTLEVKQLAEKRMNAEAETNPQVDIVWKTVAFQHKDSYALEVLARLLSTRTGRLYKGLVLGSQVATDTYAVQASQKYAGLFNIGGEAREGHSPEEVEKAIYAEVEKLQKDEVPDQELQKVKNNYAAMEYRRLSSSFAILMQLLRYDGLGNWHFVNEAGARYQAVTAADVKRVASTYLVKESRAVATYTRKPGTGGGSEDKETAGLTADQKKMLQGMMGKLNAEKDVKKVRDLLGKIEGQKQQAPAEMKAFLEVLQKKVAQRAADLEKEAK